MLVACVIVVGGLMLGSVARRCARPWRRAVEQPYVLEAADAVRFDQIVTAIFADDPGFAIRCRDLEHGE
jgi:hypothetical protein